MEFDMEQIAFLNELNNLLTDYEPVILEKVKQYQTLMENRERVVSRGVINEYDDEIMVTVQYYQNDSDGEPMHEYWTNKPTIEDSLLNTGVDGREGDFSPMLDKPYCYLMHDLMYHGSYEQKEIFMIDRIWIDIQVIDQHCLVLKEGK
jgi:hypothetical protein